MVYLSVFMVYLSIFIGFFNTHPHTPPKNNDTDPTQILNAKSISPRYFILLNFIYFLIKN